MEQSELINVYIETLNNEIASLTKQKVSLQAQLTMSERVKGALEEAVAELEGKLKKQKPAKVNDE